MRLDFSQPKPRKLVIDLPGSTAENPKICELELRRVLLAEMDAHDEKTKAINDAFQKNEIEWKEFYFQLLEHRCVNFNREICKDFDEFQLRSLMKALGELRVMEDPEKKSG